MSTFNTLRLVRILRQERDKIYSPQAMDKLCQKHKVHEKNYIHFQQIAHTFQVWGDSTLVFNKSYTFDLLDQIAQNSLKDINVFYKISQNFYPFGDSQHQIYKKMLTVFYFSYDKAPSRLNYCSGLTHQEQLEVVAQSVQYRGPITKSFDCKSEDLIVELLGSNYGFKKNFKCLESFVKNHDIKSLNIPSLSSQINPLKANAYVISLYLKYHSAVFENVCVSMEKLKKSQTLAIESDLEHVSIKRFYDLINVCAWVMNTKAPDFSGYSYESPEKIISRLDKSDDFIMTNLKNFLQKHSTASNCWLNLELALQLEDKPLKASKKI